MGAGEVRHEAARVEGGEGLDVEVELVAAGGVDRERAADVEEVLVGAGIDGDGVELPVEVAAAVPDGVARVGRAGGIAGGKGAAGVDGEAALEVSGALGEAAATRQDLESTRETLNRARQESVIANPELAILSRPGSTRGATKVELEKGASHLLILIPIDDRREKRKYRIELIGGLEPWTSPELEVLSPGELRLGIPASLLSEGKVVLRLRDSKAETPPADYELNIQFASGRTQQP